MDIKLATYVFNTRRFEAPYQIRENKNLPPIFTQLSALGRGDLTLSDSHMPAKSILAQVL